MKRLGVRLLATVILAGVLSCSLSCTIAADALNPSFFSALGIDPGTIFPSAGTIIVSFENRTTSPATFYAFEAAGPLSSEPEARNFSVVADAGGTRNEVLDCPVSVISLGVLDAAYASDGIGAVVISDGGEVEVTYAGSDLVSGQEFTCGDVVDVILTEQGGTDNEQYLLSVRVIPGR